MPEDNSKDISIKKPLFNILIVVAVSASIISSFFGGYIMGGASKIVTITPLQNSQPITTSGQDQPFLQLLQHLGSSSIQQQSSTVHVNISSSSIVGSPVKGNSSAPVTLVEFSDFQCPFCGRFFSEIMPQIQKAYIDTGKVKFVYKQYPIDSVHPNAKAASNAVECANEQGKFWQYHDILFGNQSSWVDQNTSQTNTTFKKYASSLGLNADNFNSCLNAKKYSNKIDKDLQQGSTYGVLGTPTFYIGNDKKGYTQIVGVQPFPTFQQVIDQYK